MPSHRRARRWPQPRTPAGIPSASRGLHWERAWGSGSPPFSGQSARASPDAGGTTDSVAFIGITRPGGAKSRAPAEQVDQSDSCQYDRSALPELPELADRNGRANPAGGAAVNGGRNGPAAEMNGGTPGVLASGRSHRSSAGRPERDQFPGGLSPSPGMAISTDSVVSPRRRTMVSVFPRKSRTIRLTSRRRAGFSPLTDRKMSPT